MACGNVICAQNMRCMNPSICLTPRIDQGNQFVSSGWVCPKCSSVWSPSISGCLTCNKSEVNQITQVSYTIGSFRNIKAGEINGTNEKS